MPIRLNLLAEQQEVEEARRRDPVKRAIWLAGFLVALMVLASLYLFMQGRAAAAQLRGQERTLADKQTDLNRATNVINKVKDIEAKIEALHGLATNRLLWGRVLSAFQNAVVDDVHVLKLTAQQDFKRAEEGFTNTTIAIRVYQRKGAIVSPEGMTNRISAKTEYIVGHTNSSSYTNLVITPVPLKWWNKTPPAVTNNPVVVVQKNPVVREQIKLTVDGKVYVSPNRAPIETVDIFKSSLITNLAKWLKPDGVNVTSPPQSPTPDTKDTNRFSATFTLECLFLEQTRHEVK
jgi:hypothetical protein